MKTTGVLLALAGLTTVLGYLCDPPGKPKEADAFQRPESITDFATLYKNNCVGCHGADGKLGPAPPLNDPVFLALVPDEELFHTIEGGRSGTPMPAFAQESGGPLTAQQVQILAAGIKPMWGPPAKLDHPPGFVLDHVEFTTANWKDGERTFKRACAKCHDAGGKGGPINDPNFLELISLTALRRYIVTGRPDLGMPPYFGKDGRADDFTPLTAKEIDGLLALLQHWKEKH